MSTATGAGESYDPVARFLHWGIFALMALQFALAWSMPHVGRGAKPEGLIGLHISFGVLIAAIVVVRWVWRLTHPTPLEAGTDPAWQIAAARWTHRALYALLLVLPVLGWLNGAARGWSPLLFGIVKLAQVVETGSPVARQVGELHNLLSYVLLVMIGLHVLAALYHHFWRHDGVLYRMLPRLK